MGKIVYHGTFSERPPHEYGKTFHAGTENAARERLDEAEEMGGIATMHAYEISNRAKMSGEAWLDPSTNYHHAPTVPETDTSKIYPYTNEWEDAGSTSYVIPSHFVGKTVKHLGPQFQEPRGEGGRIIMGAIRGMLGVPQTK